MSERLMQAIAYADFIVPIADRDPSPSLAEAFEAGWKASRAQPAQSVPMTDDTELIRQMLAMLRFASDNHKATKELHECCVVQELAPAIAAARKRLAVPKGRK